MLDEIEVGFDQVDELGLDVCVEADVDVEVVEGLLDVVEVEVGVEEVGVG